MFMFFCILFVVCGINVFLYCLCLLLLVAFLVLFERKVLSLLQERKSPNIVGVVSLVQTVMDGIKLLTKQSYVNYGSFYFILLPVLGLLMSFLHWLVVPFPFEIFSSDFSCVITFVIMGLMVYVVLGCGYVSSSSYGVISAVRSVAQMISYEVVFVFYFLGIMFILGGYSWSLFLYLSLLYNTFIKLFFIIIWLVLSLSELNRTPFDLVESESELVSGYNVEYSGYTFTLLFLSEYMNIWFMGLIFALLYSTTTTNLLFFMLTYAFIVLVVRGLLPRLKFVDLINMMWKVFLPFVFLFLFLFSFLVFV